MCGPWALRGGRWLVEGCKVRRRSLRSATEAKRTAAPRAGDDATRLPSPVLNVDGCGWGGASTLTACGALGGEACSAEG